MKASYLLVLLAIVQWNCTNNTNSTEKVKDTTVTQQVQGVTPPADPAPTSTSVLPSFSMMNSADKVVDLASYKGKKIFVNLWATWCPPCRAEIPSIEALAQKTDKNKVEFVMLSLDDNFEKAKNYSVSNKMKLPVYYPAGTLPQLFTVDGIPVTYIFNENGEIVFQQVGSENYDTQKFVDLLK